MNLLDDNLGRLSPAHSSSALQPLPPVLMNQRRCQTGLLHLESSMWEEKHKSREGHRSMTKVDGVSSVYLLVSWLCHLVILVLYVFGQEN